MTTSNFTEQYEWQERQHGEVFRWFNQYIDQNCRIWYSTEYEDMKEGKDIEVEPFGAAGRQRGGLRIRKIESVPRGGITDVTFRSYSRGNPTELDKLRADPVDVYLYVWIQGHRVYQAVYLDLKEATRNWQPFHRKWQTTMNKDGETGFIAIPVYCFQECGGLVTGRDAFGFRWTSYQEFYRHRNSWNAKYRNEPWWKIHPTPVPPIDKTL